MEAWDLVLGYEAGGFDGEACSQTQSPESLEFFDSGKVWPLGDGYIH